MLLLCCQSAYACEKYSVLYIGIPDPNIQYVIPPTENDLYAQLDEAIVSDGSLPTFIFYKSFDQNICFEKKEYRDEKDDVSIYGVALGKNQNETNRFIFSEHQFDEMMTNSQIKRYPLKNQTTNDQVYPLKPYRIPTKKGKPFKDPYSDNWIDPEVINRGKE